MNAVAALATALVVVLTLSGRADAQVVPFKVTGSGVAGYLPLPGEAPAPHYATGTATHLGEYYGSGKVQVDWSTFDPETGTADFFSAEPFVFEAANGDQLAFNYAGTVYLIPRADGLFDSMWVADFTPVPEACTGRFADVIDGSFTMTAITEPFFPTQTDVSYTWSGEGWIEFANDGD
jgi:hypothetical protein